MADEIFLVNSSSFQILEVSTSLRAGLGATVDLTQAATVSGSFSGEGVGLTNVSASYIVPTANATASWAISASLASSSLSSSYLNPGSMLWVVSGSNGIAPAFLAPYDYSVDNVYRPTPIREGYTHWDHKWNNWAVFDDSGARTHLGREIVIAVHNPSAVSIPRLAPVYISGSSAPLQATWSTYKPDIYLAQADGTGTKARVVGVVRQAIPSGSDGYILCAGTMHNSNMIPFGSVGTELWLSPTVAGGLTTTKPGQPNEVVSVGYVIEAGGTGSLLVALETEPPPANAYAGMTAPVRITDDTASLQIYVDSASVNLYSNAEGIGRITGYPVPTVTMSLGSSSYASYVYAESNGITASYQMTTDFSSINGTNKAFVATVYRADIDTHALITNEEGLALANKINNRFLATEKFGYESGFTLSETGSRNIFVTSGKVWFGATQLIEDDFDSRLSESVAVPYHEVHWAVHSASAWSIPTLPDGKYPNVYYDDGTNSASLAPNSYSLHYVFRILGDNPTDEDAFLITSNYQYPDVASAQNDTIPTGIPTVITDVGLLVGRIIFQSGSSQASLVESAFTTNFGQSLVTQHNGLGGLQGGQGGEYYHLKATEYTGTGTGLFVRQTGASITATGSLDGSASYAERATFASSAVSSSFAGVTLSSSQALFSDSASYATRGLSSSYAIRSTNAESSLTADTASFATYASTTNTAVTVSWANNSVSASWAPMPTVSDSSSWASQSLSSSFAVRSSTADAAFNADTASFATYASTFNTAVTVSWANNAVSASWAPGGQVGPVASASWASQSLSSSYAVTTNTAITVSYADFATSASWAPGGQMGPVESASWASSSLSSSYAVRASNADSSSYANYATSTNTAITTSWSNNAVSASRAISSANADTSSFSSYASTTNTAITTSWAVNATSASFASKAATSDTATSATSASFADTTIAADTATSASFASRTITSSFSVLAANANTASFATYAATTNTAITTSWANNVVSASYASTTNLSGLVFSKGVTFFDPIGLTGTSSFSQSVVIWRAAVPCTASSIWVFKEGGNESLGSASINVRNNNLNLISSSFQVTQSQGWVGVTALTNNNFVIGDTLDVILLTSSFYPQQVAVQINFVRH